MWIKICGTTNLEDAKAAIEAGADAIGFIFLPSKRQVTPELAAEIARALPRTFEKVGVFSNESATRIEEIVATVGLTVVQLHGDETPEFARNLLRQNGTNMRSRVRVFKTVHMVSGVESELRNYASGKSVDGLLLDSVVRDPVSGQIARGGTGQTFDWHRTADFLPGVQRKTRVIVAGGLTAENVVDAVRLLQPWGVDVCSGVESEPGRKDRDKLRRFVTAAREARN
jgi:phosphoribosylanthranilate isomerase